MNVVKFLVLFLMVLISSLLTAQSSVWAAIDPENHALPYEVKDGQILIQANSAFAGKFKVAPVQLVAGAKKLKSIGQVIALANHSPSLSAGDQLSWVELDPHLSTQVGLKLNQIAKPSIGIAVGMSWVPSSYLGKLKEGQKITVFRYGLQKTSVSGSILSLGKPSFSEEEGVARFVVLFRLDSGQTWYPGTNCQIEFPIPGSTTAQVPSTAILHEGVQEYVMREVTPGKYEPQTISIVSENAGSAEILSQLQENDRVIETGAILLKPVLPELLKSVSKEGGQATSLR